jgi:uncharacterized protein YkwD
MGRRWITGAFLLLASTVVLAFPLAAPAAATSGIVREINATRAAHGLRPLRLSVALEDAAHAHSAEMARVGYFAHHSADGGSFAARLRRWYARRDRWAAGENLGWATPTITGGHLVQLWLASPEHRANILDPSWRDVGCSVVHAASAPGVFDEAPVTLVTCDFGARS